MWTKEQMKFLLANSDKAVERALLTLLERQTEDEKRSEDTKHRNDQGFTQADAKRFTSMAKQVLAGRPLSPKQLAWLRNGRSERYPSRIGKYAGQLVELTNEKIKKCDEQIAIWKAKAEHNQYADSFEQWGRVDRECKRQIVAWEAEKQRLLPKKIPAMMAAAATQDKAA